MQLFTSERSPATYFSKPSLQQVLVVQLDDAAAIVMLSPALRALREALPYAELTLMTSAGGGQLAPLLPWVDHVMIDQAIGHVGAARRGIDPREDVACVERLRRQNYSIALIFTSISQSSMRAAYACYLAGIPYRVGFAKGLSGSMLSHFLLPPAEDVHPVERNLNLLQAIGIDGVDQRMQLEIPQNVENRARELLNTMGVKPDIPYIVVAPGTDGLIHQYNPKHFATVAHLLAAQTEQQLLVVGSSAEARCMQPLLQVTNENLYGNMYSLVDKTTLPELAAIIRNATLTISTNSLSMQFADVFGCPMVILYSETGIVNPGLPRLASARLLSRPASCSRCHQQDCRNGIQCLDVRPEEVAIAALEMLSEQPYEQTDYKGIFGYEIAPETNESSPAH